MSDNPFEGCRNCPSYDRGQGTKKCLTCKQYKLFNETWNNGDTIQVVHIPEELMDAVADVNKKVPNLLEAIRKLDPKDQACILMQHYGGCTVDEIAEALNVTATVIDRRVKRARVSIKKMLSNDNSIVE